MGAKKRLGVYAGSFDPLTIGHVWMVEQGARLFDRLVVAMGINPEKRYAFPLEQRLTMLRESLKPFRNVSVASFSNRYFNAKIRQEYVWVPNSLFGSKRANILEQFLARQELFQNVRSF